MSLAKLSRNAVAVSLSSRPKSGAFPKNRTVELGKACSYGIGHQTTCPSSDSKLSLGNDRFLGFGNVLCTVLVIKADAEASSRALAVPESKSMTQAQTATGHGKAVQATRVV